MITAENNCAIRAIHAITGEAPEDIAAGIAAFPNAAGAPGFCTNGVDGDCLSAYLEARGWKELFFEDRPSIPMTSVISVHGHCFAIVDGRIYDSGPGGYSDMPIISVFVPPGVVKSADRQLLDRAVTLQPRKALIE